MDMMSMLNIFGESFPELICGGRHNIYLKRWERFLSCLRDEFGAKLVIVCDGCIHKDKIATWCSRRNVEYAQYVTVFEDIDNGLRSSEIEERLKKKHPYKDHRACRSVVTSMLLIARKYGKVVIAIEHECDRVIAKYAAKYKALAVISNDSDFVVFEGNWQNWQYWHSSTIDLENMTIMQFDRQLFLNHYNLTRLEARIVATISGTDYTKCYNLSARFGQNKNPKTHFLKISNFVKDLKVGHRLRETFCRDLCRRLLTKTRCLNEIVEKVKSSIEFYSVDFDDPPNMDEIQKHIAENVMMTAFLKKEIFQYEVSFVDFREINNNSFALVAMEVFKRLAGILWKHTMYMYEYKDRVQKVKVLTKLSHDQVYDQPKTIKPIYPIGESIIV